MRCINEDRASFYIDQSTHDAPCRVRFAASDALMSLSRWGGKASLAFAPGDSHLGETRVRGNELLLKSEATPKRYHVFRRLDGERFEYDVVLLKEPETNVIEIELDFPDGLEFFRQPSMENLLSSPYRCAPEVVESYAVYWKDRNGPYKTGKFCHIYRPEIRDARDRKVWGRLDIVGHRMTITIPEEWLSDAAYPVVVDPIVGTQTRGALRQIDWYNEDDPRDFSLELEFGVNRFTAPNTFEGLCTSYVYSCSNDSESRGQAVLYSNDEPGIRLSRDEQKVNLTRTTPGWVPSTFTLSRAIAQGETFWYGYCAWWLETYYDVGGLFTKDWAEDEVIPETIITNSEFNWNIFMSMYFEYTASENYTCSIINNFQVTENVSRFHGVSKTCTGSITTNDIVFYRGFWNRLCSGITTVGDGCTIIQELIRGCISYIETVSDLHIVQALIRTCMTIIGLVETLGRRISRWRIVESGLSFIECVTARMILKKEELIIVSRVTREIEFKGDLF